MFPVCEACLRLINIISFNLILPSKICIKSIPSISIIDFRTELPVSVHSDEYGPREMNKPSVFFNLPCIFPPNVYKSAAMIDFSCHLASNR